jgi:hypothetical protein
MGVCWTDPHRVPPNHMGTPDPAAGVPAHGPGHEEGPDQVVRPVESEHDGLYDLSPARRCANAVGRVPRTTDHAPPRRPPPAGAPVTLTPGYGAPSRTTAPLLLTRDLCGAMQMDIGHSFDRPHEIDNTPDAHRPAEPRTYLAALAERLKSQYDVELTDDGLIVRHCDKPDGVITVTCRRRLDDGGRWWFIASCGEPIAEIDRIADTVVAIHGYLTGERP